MTAVLFTLKEAAYLWVRNFWYIVLVVLVAELPDLAVNYGLLQLHGPPPYVGGFLGYPTFLIGSEALALFALGFIFVAALKASSIIGLLRRSLTGRKAPAAIGHELAASGWKIFVVLLLLGLIGILPFVASYAIHPDILRSHIIVKVLRYLLFLAVRFALPFPLIAQEGRGPFGALGAAIGMVFRYFWYVAACYAVFAVGDWFYDKVVIHFLFGLSWSVYILPPLWSLGDTGWVVLSWCMYVHIRTQENPAAEGHLPETPDEEPATA